jgi:uncharacterized membrane protein HdeD (DUF308 family)
MSTSNAQRISGVFGDLHKNWGWLLAVGILSLVLGTIGLGRVFLLTLVGVLFYGWLFLILGAVQLVQLFQCRGWKSVMWHGFVAVLYVLAGLSVIENPALASSLLTLVLGGFILANGVLRTFVGFQHRDIGGWIWAVLGGVISIVLGLLILGHWPATSFYVIGLFIAIELIVNGWTLVVLALAARAASAGMASSHPT